MKCGVADYQGFCGPCDSGILYNAIVQTVISHSPYKAIMWVQTTAEGYIFVCTKTK